MKARIAAALAGTVVLAWGCQTVGASAPRAPTTHTYYVAADEVVWDYAPTNMNKIANEPFDEMGRLFMESGPRAIGHE